MSAGDPNPRLEEIKQALFAGRKIEAIKLYREAMNCQLIESKQAMDKLEAELRASSPERFAAPLRGKGCAGVLAAIALIGVCAIAIVSWLSMN